MLEIFDSHAHYDDSAFEEDRETLLNDLHNYKNVCCIVNASSNIPDTKKSIELAKKYDYIYACVGIHPNDSDEVPDDYIDQLRELAKEKKVVSVGEIGLDFYYEVDKEKQLKVFEELLQLAIELDLPVIIHNREAHEKTLNLLKKYKPRGVVHCFSGSVEMAKEIIKLGMYIGVGGAVTFKNARHLPMVVQEIPMEKILLETDAPYMSPVPFRGKRCDSSYIEYTIQKIAELKDISPMQVATIAKENACNLFNIKL